MLSHDMFLGCPFKKKCAKTHSQRTLLNKKCAPFRATIIGISFSFCLSKSAACQQVIDLLVVDLQVTRQHRGLFRAKRHATPTTPTQQQCLEALLCSASILPWISDRKKMLFFMLIHNGFMLHCGLSMVFTIKPLSLLAQYFRLRRFGRINPINRPWPMASSAAFFILCSNSL